MPGINRQRQLWSGWCMKRVIHISVHSYHMEKFIVAQIGRWRSWLACFIASVNLMASGQVAPQVPGGLDSNGNAFEAPGVYPGRLTASLVDIRVEPGSVLGGDKSNNLSVTFPAFGPVQWTESRHNEGDIAFNVGPFSPDAIPPAVPFQEWAPNDGPTTYAWTIDRRHGVTLATVRANGFDNQDTANGQPVGTQYGVAYFTHGFRSGFGYSPVDGVWGNGNFSQDLVMGMVGPVDEASFDVSVVHFPYSEGWTGAHVSSEEPGEDGVVIFENQENGGSIGYGVNPFLIKWVDADDNFFFDEGLSRIELPGVDSLNDGMLFVAPAHDSSNTKIAGAVPTGDAWYVTIRDDRTTSDDSALNPRESSEFTFLYLPYETPGLVGGHVRGSDGNSINSAGDFTVARTEAGRYELSIPGRTGMDGMIILSNAGEKTDGGLAVLASHAFLCYEYSDEESVFVIESNQLSPDGVEAVDSDFYFAWIDFENPIHPAPMDAPRLIPGVPFGYTWLMDPFDPTSQLIQVESNIGVNTDSPEALVITIFNSYNFMDPFNDLGFLFDPVTGNENVGVLLGYRINTLTGAGIGEPFIILGNPHGEISKNDVKYNPVTGQYVVVATAQQFGDNAANIPVIVTVNPAESVAQGLPDVDRIIAHDVESTISYQDVGLAVSSRNGNFMVVAEYQVPDEGEAVSAFIYSGDGQLLSNPVNRVDTLVPANDEDDPDVSYLPMADVFLFNTNVDTPIGDAGNQNRITLTAIQTEPDADGSLLSGPQQIVGELRLEGNRAGHPSAIENPFTGEIIVAFDYGNGSDGGDLIYVNLNEDLSFSPSRSQAPYFEALGNEPFSHRHPQMAVDPVREIIVIAHNANGASNGVNGMALTLLDRNGEVLPGRSEKFHGFHGFIHSAAIIDSGANFHNIKYDPASGGFLVVYNDQSGLTRVSRVRIETPAGEGDSGDTYRLQILHASDLEGGVRAIDLIPNFAAIVDRLKHDFANTIVLSAGDNFIPGPFFSAAGDRSMRSRFQSVYNQLFDTGEALSDLREAAGRADITVMNIIGFDASVFGNHEFDSGTSILREIIGADIRGTSPADARWLGAQFPYLSANLDFSGDGSLSPLFTDELLDSNEFRSLPADPVAAGAAPKIAPFTTIQRSGERIGIIGATTPQVRAISSPGDTVVKNPGAGTNNMDSLASILQPVINRLTAEGINKVILVTHLQQISLEKELIGKLSGVDVIIAGGSDTIQADETDILHSGDTADETYPFLTTNADGDPALVVSTDGEYKYVGRLVVEFDGDGVLVPGALDPLTNGPVATTEEGLASVWGEQTDQAFVEGSIGGLAQVIATSVREIVIGKDANIVGRSSVFLEGRRNAVRTEETNMGILTARANLAYAREVDPEVVISHKNGGGIRSEIGSIDGFTGEPGATLSNDLSGKQAGEISQLDIENSLRFNNGLTLMTVTAEELLSLIEHGVADSSPGNTPGRFPQVAGIRFAFDPDFPAGRRLSSLVVINDAGETVDTILSNGVFQGEPSREFRMVTLNFLADGGDGYPFDIIEATSPARVNRVDLMDVITDPGTSDFAPPGTEQDALAEYLLGSFNETDFSLADTSVIDDQFIQNEMFRPNTIHPGVRILASVIEGLMHISFRADTGFHSVIRTRPEVNSGEWSTSGEPIPGDQSFQTVPVSTVEKAGFFQVIQQAE